MTSIEWWPTSRWLSSIGPTSSESTTSPSPATWRGCSAGCPNCPGPDYGLPHGIAPHLGAFERRSRRASADAGRGRRAILPAGRRAGRSGSDRRSRARGAGEDGDGTLRTELEPLVPLLQSGSLFGDTTGSRDRRCPEPPGRRGGGAGGAADVAPTLSRSRSCCS